MMEGAGSRLVIADRWLFLARAFYLLGRAHDKAVQAARPSFSPRLRYLLKCKFLQLGRMPRVEPYVAKQKTTDAF